MNLILDINILHKVLEPQSRHFADFKPVYKCIYECKGKVIWGGKTYKQEFIKARKYLNVLTQLNIKKPGKFFKLDDSAVNAKEKAIYDLQPKTRRFDDAHLIACAIIGRCKVICTDDSTADKYITDPRFYPKSTMRPSIYRNASHRHLLNDCW